MAGPAAKQTNNKESKVLRGEWRQASTLLPYPPSILRHSPTELTQFRSVLKYLTYLTIFGVGPIIEAYMYICGCL